MRSSIDPVKQVAIILYYLSDEGRIRKTANAFEVSRQSILNIVRKVCQAMTVHLRPVERPMRSELSGEKFS